MNTLTIISIITAVLLIAGIFILSTGMISAETPKSENKKCSGCNGDCTKENNCGLESCSAFRGKPCNCNK